MTSAICKCLLICTRWASANRNANATDSGSFDCISSIHGPSICSRSDRAIKATISTHGIRAAGVSLSCRRPSSQSALVSPTPSDGHHDLCKSQKHQLVYMIKQLSPRHGSNLNQQLEINRRKHGSQGRNRKLVLPSRAGNRRWQAGSHA